MSGEGPVSEEPTLRARRRLDRCFAWKGALRNPIHRRIARVSSTNVNGAIEVRDLRPAEVDEAAGVLARGFRDNPLNMAAFGDDPERRVRVYERSIEHMFRVLSAQQPLCAIRDGTLVGVTGVAPVGRCQPSATERLRLLPSFLALGPRTAARVVRWTSAWAQRDPDDPHVHLGPFAVDAHLQRQGIGSLIMREHCRRLDAAGEVGYLETDKPENVRFYERFGFEVIGEERVIGVTNWFMRRPASFGRESLEESQAPHRLPPRSHGSGGVTA
jgi:ribosomal protein S18 acetylase RimI-like enzyme